MKIFRLLLCVFASVTTASAQNQYLDFNQKRADLISSLRILGPLNAPDWLSTLPLLAGNYGVVYSDYTYHYVGNYGYIYLGPDPSGQYAYLYDYKYRNTGVWVGSEDPFLNNTSAAFSGSFGIGMQTIPPSGPVNYSFSLSSGSYSVAGLRYESVFIVNGRSGSSALGWTVNRGQTVNTGLPFSTGQTFDLAQNVEIPSFRISDYWYGPYYNYPQDAVVAPTPQNTRRQTQQALVVGSPFNLTTNVAWVQEGVYRPGFALQPGYSTPRLYTYMEQYFESAWKCDAVSGQPLRLSATNWNGVGKIDILAAAPSGTLAAQGYYFTPTEPVKVILKTQPQENGFYGELPFYAVQLLVDKNRDGILNANDVTTSGNPHTFWVNNDCDRAQYTADDLWDELDLDLNTTITDTAFVQSNFRIPTLRDLEDYDRLHVRGLKELCRDLPTGQGYTVTMRWKTILSGNPGIFVFKSSDTSGSQSYLTSSTAANAQIAPSLYPPSGSPGLSPLAIGRVESGISPVLHNDNGRGTNDYFIYCGTSRGAGELAVTVYKSGNIIGESSIFLDLRDVKELYERWTLGDGNGGEPAMTPSLVSSGLPAGVPATQFGDSTASARDYILFVHGWNMEPWEKDSFAETAFKRLYWQGYTNRFGSLRWPTKYGFSDKLFSTTGPFIDPTHYDSSEFTAWKSGEGLRSHLVSLNQRYPGRSFMMAHSMGNIVAGEALALNAEKYHGGQIVNTYVASQAAVPLDCYKPNGSEPVFQMPFQYEHPKQQEFGQYLALISDFGWILSELNGPIDWDSGTPNVYQGWLNTNRASCGARVNFYNPNDYALNMPVWGMNQLVKPDKMGSASYSYVRFPSGLIPFIGGSSSTPAYFFIPSPARSGSPVLSGVRQRPGYFKADNGMFPVYLDFEFRLNDAYEAMAFASEARSYPLGKISDGVSLERALNLSLVWPADTEPLSGNFSRHKWHSGEFRSNYNKQQIYWANLVGQAGFRLFGDR